MLQCAFFDLDVVSSKENMLLFTQLLPKLNFSYIDIMIKNYQDLCYYSNDTLFENITFNDKFVTKQFKYCNFLHKILKRIEELSSECT